MGAPISPTLLLCWVEDQKTVTGHSKDSSTTPLIESRKHLNTDLVKPLDTHKSFNDGSWRRMVKKMKKKKSQSKIINFLVKMKNTQSKECHYSRSTDYKPRLQFK